MQRGQAPALRLGASTAVQSGPEAELAGAILDKFGELVRTQHPARGGRSRGSRLGALPGAAARRAEAQGFQADFSPLQAPEEQ